MDRLRLRLPGLWFDWNHSRHFWEALSQHPGVQVASVGEHADFGINTGPADRIVRLFRSDPHSLALELDIREMLTDEVKLCAVAGCPEFEAHLRGAYINEVRAMNPDPQIPVLEQADLFCPPFRDPYERLLMPRLTRPKLLRVPFSVPGEIFHVTLQEERFLDVFFLGAVGQFYPVRMLAIKALRAEMGDPLMPRSAIKFYHGQAPSPAQLQEFAEDHRTFDKHQRWYADCLRHAKIMPVSPGVFGYPVQKYVEAMACGVLVIGTLPRDAESLGFRDRETMVVCTHEDFMEKVRYYLAHDEERKRIVYNAHALVQRNYTCEAAARILVEQLTMIRAGAAVESVDQWGLR